MKKKVVIKDVEPMTGENDCCKVHIENCYQITIHCRNCSRTEEYWVRRGITEAKAIKKIPAFICNNCGCDF